MLTWKASNYCGGGWGSVNHCAYHVTMVADLMLRNPISSNLALIWARVSPSVFHDLTRYLSHHGNITRWRWRRWGIVNFHNRSLTDNQDNHTSDTCVRQHNLLRSVNFNCYKQTKPNKTKEKISRMVELILGAYLPKLGFCCLKIFLF